MNIIINPKKIVLFWSFVTFFLVVLLFLPYARLDDISKVLFSLGVAFFCSLFIYGFGIIALRFIKKDETFKAFFLALCFIPLGAIVEVSIFLVDFNYSFTLWSIFVGFILTIFGCVLLAILNKEVEKGKTDSVTISTQPSKFSWNILTRIMGIVCFGGLIFGIAAISSIGNAEFGFLAAYYIIFWIGLPTVIIGLTQIIITAIRWKRLAVLDKVIFAIVLMCVLFSSLHLSSLFGGALDNYRSSIIAKQAVKRDNIDSCRELSGHPTLQASCYRPFAIKRQDPNLCEPFDSDCFAEIAIILKDPSVCESEKAYNTSYILCYNKVFGEIWKDIADKDAKCREIFLGAKCTNKSTAGSFSYMRNAAKFGICKEWFIERQSLCLAEGKYYYEASADLPTLKYLVAKFFDGTSPFAQLTFDYSVADYFNIYRATNLDGPWELILADFPSSAHSFVDYNLPKNTKELYYRITVSDGQGGEGPYSPVSSVNLP